MRHCLFFFCVLPILAARANNGDFLQPASGRTATAPNVRTAEPKQPQNALKTEPALSGILRLFDNYQVVGLSDLHGCAELLAFVEELVQAPGFAAKLNDFTFEPGNVRFQDLMDDFILQGKNVLLTDLRRCWRENTQAHAFSDTPALFHLLQTIRETNLRQAAERRIRVLLIDPPVDWSQIRSKEDLRRQDFDRETHMAKVLEREVYAKGRKALFFAGGAHLSRGGSPLTSLEQNHPGTTYAIGIHEGFGDRTDELEAKLALWPRPALAPIRGTWWGELTPPPSGDIFIGPDGKRVQPPSQRKFQDNWDAVLFLGKRRDLTRVDPPGPAILSEAWVTELKRRKAIMGRPPGEFAPPSLPRSHQFFPDDALQGDRMIRLPLGEPPPGPPAAPPFREKEEKP